MLLNQVGLKFLYASVTIDVDLIPSGALLISNKPRSDHKHEANNHKCNHIGYEIRKHHQSHAAQERQYFLLLFTIDEIGNPERTE